MTLRDLRESKSMSQAEMGRMLGITQTAYCRYELGQRKIPTSIASKLASMFNLNITQVWKMLYEK